MLRHISGVIKQTRRSESPFGQWISIFSLLLASGMGVAGCTSYESAYEEAVYDWEPLYCYRSLADVSCMRTPYFRDEKRLTNFFGPSPNRYDRPTPPPPARLDPPPVASAPFVLPERSIDQPVDVPEPEKPTVLPVHPADQPEQV